jgi:hypothetical protein
MLVTVSRFLISWIARDIPRKLAELPKRKNPCTSPMRIGRWGTLNSKAVEFEVGYPAKYFLRGSASRIVCRLSRSDSNGADRQIPRYCHID